MNFLEMLLLGSLLVIVFSTQTVLIQSNKKFSSAIMVIIGLLSIMLYCLRGYLSV